MTYSLTNKCAKNYYNRTFIVPVIAKNVVTCFFLRHSVDKSITSEQRRRRFAVALKFSLCPVADGQTDYAARPCAI